MKLYRGSGLGSMGLQGREYYKYLGEKRCPKKGEFYISGAKPEVYKAYNDLSQIYHIATPVPPPPQTIEKDGFTYRLCC